MLDLNEINLFVHVVRAGSFTGAGRTLGVPKSTVSRRVSSLEERLGLRLLERTTRKLRLTEAGRAYYERCRRAVEELEEADRDVHAFDDEPRGVLRMTAPHGAVDELLGPALVAVLREHPEVHVELELTDRTVDLVEEGFDLALRGGPLADSSLVVRRLISEPARLFAHGDYLARRGTPTHPRELTGHDCLYFPYPGREATWSLVRDDERVDVDVVARLSCNSSEMTLLAAREALGIALIPRFRGTRLDADDLVPVLPEWQGAVASGVSVVYPSRRFLTPKVRAVAEALERRVEVLRGS